jgi:hypothetical protein
MDAMFRLAVLACVLAAWSMPAMAQEDRGAIVLERFASTQGRSSEVAIGACRRDGCAVEIRLSEGERVIARHATGWRVAARRSTRADSEATNEIIEAGVRQTIAWQFGAEASQSLLAVRPVRLADEAGALLLMHRAGFEHVKREFMLVTAEGDTLRRLWRGGDGAAGPFVSWVELLQNDGRDRLTYFRALDHPEPDQLDTISVRTLAWDAAGRRVRERPARGLWAVVGGGYADAAATRAARAHARQTSVFFWTLAADKLLRRPEGPVALVALTSLEARARQLLGEARRSGFPQAFLTRANPGRP